MSHMCISCKNAGSVGYFGIPNKTEVRQDTSGNLVTIETRRQWCSALDLDLEKVPMSARVCFRHFLTEEIVVGGKSNASDGGTRRVRLAPGKM